MTEAYEPRHIEPKWQQRWQEARLFRTQDDPSKPKCYVLAFFPYPSGDGLSVGHCRNYIPCDAVARLMRMRGYNVLHPMGWDAFGLPAENEAINKGSHPKQTVPRYVANYKRQMNLIGLSYDWEREINSSQPDYYKWTQWWFLQLYKRGLAYRANAPVNWCPRCRTVLANEEVEGGKCWRCGTLVDKRDMPQWFFKITAYADRLLEDLDEVDWPEGIKQMQRHWIGRSEGVEFEMAVQGRPDLKFRVFTTRIDTVFGMTFAVLAPEHPLVDAITTPEQRAAVEAYRARARRLDEATRLSAERERTGVFTGAYAVNPANDAPVPIYVADYVLMTYGTGAIMAVPAHDERDYDFARKYGLPIRVVITPDGGAPDPDATPECYTGDGVMVNSGEFSGLPNREGMQRLAEWFEARGLGARRVNYRLRDWLISRQRYWGAPIPIVHCPACGEVPVPEDQLPVLLPDVEAYQPSGTGESPLANIPEFVNTSCPQCGQPARRETDTMGGFACSSWYFLRFCDPHNDAEPFAQDKVRYWMPVDYYVGGAEHAVMHLLYARFWTKVGYDAGFVPVKEPFYRLRNQGMVLALTPYRPPRDDETLREGEIGILVRRDQLEQMPDAEKAGLLWQWEKMSKSRYNVVTPDEIVERYSADTLRLYELFVAPFDTAIEWKEEGVKGMHRFLGRVWRLMREARPCFVRDWRPILNESCQTPECPLDEPARKMRQRTHASLKKIAADIPDFRFNTAVATLMEWFNHLEDYWKQVNHQPCCADAMAVVSEAVECFILALSPFAPHIADELWEAYGFEGFTLQQPFPQHDESLARADEFEMVVQVNGKLRDRIVVPADITREAMEQLALASPRVQAHLEGKPPRKVIVVPGKLVNIVV
ncbi:MAG: leucine--tRNA ligase [Fimbriimonadales bacterium]|nr:MAG: leucine--tRNA ligase [Fimbriimonadales bacterium]